MDICNIFKEIFTGVRSVVGYLLTHPRLIKPTRGRRVINVEIVENNDMTINSTSGLPELHYKSSGRPPKPHVFLYVTIENSPYIPTNSTAKGVSVEVVCIGRKSKRKVGPYPARPMDTPAPFSSPNYGKYEASRVDIPPGKLLRGFYIAFHVPGDDKFYGFSQSSYEYYTTIRGDNIRVYDWKNPALEMGGETYDVTVVFSGENFKPFEYKFPLSISFR